MENSFSSLTKEFKRMEISLTVNTKYFDIERPEKNSSVMSAMQQLGIDIDKRDGYRIYEVSQKVHSNDESEVILKVDYEVSKSS